MKVHPVAFISVMDYDNLGVGYMASILSENGYETRILDFSQRRSDILRSLKRLDPILIGFSVIFHNYIDKFAELTSYLREKGIKCHITAGGHYASLRYEELFQLIPQLDSIVRFEGEYPVVELVKCLSNGSDWRKVASIAYRENNRILANNVWPPEKDLDRFPFPARSAMKKYAFDKKFTTILAGRGCIHNCSFCNTREFYRQASGPIKRIRKPEAVVSEMEYLFNEKQCSVFIFHDDDFPVRTAGKSDWIKRFCTELERRDLHDKIIWKINCRPDEIDEETFSMLKRYGLYLVFLGIEDGTDRGLKRLHKNMSVGDTLKGIEILKRLEIGFDYGFILFQPATTFMSLKKNLDFLKHVCSDGYTAATFLRLVPFYNTLVEEELIKEGRLKIADNCMDYNFYEESLDDYYDFIVECFNDWMRKPDGVENISKWARNYFSVYLHYYDIRPEVIAIHNKLRAIISRSNVFMLETMKELASVFETGLYKTKNSDSLENYRMTIKSKQLNYREDIINTMAKLMTIAEQRLII